MHLYDIQVYTINYDKLACPFHRLSYILHIITACFNFRLVLGTGDFWEKTNGYSRRSGSKSRMHQGNNAAVSIQRNCSSWSKQLLPHTVNCVRLCFWRCLWLFCLCIKISREPLNGFATNSHGGRIWSFARTSLKIKVKVSFGGLRAVYVWKNIFALV